MMAGLRILEALMMQLTSKSQPWLNQIVLGYRHNKSGAVWEFATIYLQINWQQG